MLLNSYSRKVDRKKRALRFPVEMRPHFGDGLIATIEPAGSLCIYTMPQWLPVQEALMNLPILEASASRLQRLMVGHATETAVDSRNRIVIPREMAEIAQLEDEVAVLCIGTRMRVLPKRRWIEIQRDPGSSESSRFLNSIHGAFPDSEHELRVEAPLAELLEDKYRELFACQARKDYRQIEQLVGEIFDAHEVGIVEVTQYSQDDGFDLIVYFRTDTAWEVLFVQIKGGKLCVTVSDVRELVGAISIRGGHAGLLITASSASTHALNACDRSRGTAISVEISGAYQLARWLERRLLDQAGARSAVVHR